MFGRTTIWLVLTVALASVSMAVPQELPEGEGKKLLEERCTSCHDLKPVVSLRQGQDAWRELVFKMRGYGIPAVRSWRHVKRMPVSFV